MLTVASLVLAVAVAALVMFGAAGDGYRVGLTLPNAGQLVEGNQVKVGGVPVGLVEEILLSDDGRAAMELSILDEGLAPLHEGTTATLRSTSLAGIANRYLALHPGPNDAPEIPDGGEIPAEDGRAAVDLDQVLNTLGPATQADLRAAVRESASIFEDEDTARQVNEALEVLNPALSQGAATARELARDRRELERLLVESAQVSSAIASRPEDLEELVGNALAATGELARESEAIESSLERLPPTLRRTNTTLVNLRGTIRDLRPAVREARPAAPLLSETLTRLRPIARAALPEVRALRRTIDRPRSSADLMGVLRGLEEVARVAVPAFDSTVKVVADAMPVVRDARPYTPELFGGLVNGFGGTTAGYYDANGHYARISVQSSVYSLNDEGTLVPVPEAPDGLAGYRKRVIERCPGAATQPAPDRSNPFRDGRGDDFPCDLEDSPR